MEFNKIFTIDDINFSWAGTIYDNIHINTEMSFNLELLKSV